MTRKSAESAGAVENTDCITVRRLTTSVLDIARLQPWRFRECRVPLLIAIALRSPLTGSGCT